MKNLSLTLGLWVLGAAMCAAEPIELNSSILNFQIPG